MKIKKRLKMKEIVSKFNTKVDTVEFNKQLERINNNVTVFSDKLEFRLPAMEMEFNRRILNKADIESVNQALSKKVDNTFMDTIIERINGVEELAHKAMEIAKDADGDGAGADDGVDYMENGEGEEFDP